MNAYLVTSDFSMGEYGEEGPIGEIVLAETRGKARALITWEYNLVYTEKGVSIRKIATGLDVKPGIMDIDHPLWELIEGILKDEEIQQ